MKRTLLSVTGMLVFFALSHASGKVDWQEYAGRYVLPEESVVETVDIVLQSDTVLTVFSEIGEIRLLCVGKDRFEFPQYGGIVVFERDEKQKITACRISVAAINVEEIKAKKNNPQGRMEKGTR